MALSMLSLAKPASHLLLYSFVFGGSTFYSYFASPIAFRVLQREEFSKLQNHVFPYFFKMQAFAPIVLGLTAPIPLQTGAIASLAIAGVSGFVNLAWLLPWTRNVKERRREVAQIGSEADREAKDAPLRKEFGKSHGLSLLFNLSHTLALLSYGVCLSRVFLL